MQINIQELDKDLVKKLLAVYLDPKIPSHINFWCLAGVGQASLAASNLRAIKPDILSQDAEHKYTKFDMSREAFRAKLPQSFEEFQKRLNYLIALDAAIHAYGKPVEEETIEAVDVNKNRNSLEYGITTFKRNPSKSEYASKIGKGVFCLDLGEFFPECKGEFIVGPFCSKQYDSNGEAVVTERSLDERGAYISENKYADFLQLLEDHQYEYDKGFGYGDYDEVYGKPHLDIADGICDELERFGKLVMQYAEGETAQARKFVAFARENGEFNGGEAGQSPAQKPTNELSM